MRRSPTHALVLAVLTVLTSGCKKATPDATSGSGSAGSAGSASAVTGSASATAPPDAAVPDASAIGFATTISDDGVGPITATTPPAKIASLFPGLDHASEMIETEATKAEHIKLSKGTQALLSVVVDHNTDAKAIFIVTITDAMFATASGIGPTSTVADLAKQHPDATCTYETDTDEETGEVDSALFCMVPSLKRVSFHLDNKKFKGKAGAVATAKIDKLPIVEIVWRAKPE